MRIAGRYNKLACGQPSLLRFPIRPLCIRAAPDIKILVGCETSGTVRNEFLKLVNLVEIDLATPEQAYSQCA